MQLHTILLVVVGILTALSGISIFVGSRKNERKASLYFLLAAFFATWWIISIAVFLALKPEHSDFAKIAIFGVYTAAPLMDACLLAYVGHQYKPARWLAVLFALGAAVFGGALLYDSSFLYSSITIANTGNSIALSWNWYYIAYLVYLVCLNSAILGVLLYRYLKARNKAQRQGSLLFLVGMGITGMLALIFNAILPPQRYDLIWIGPLSIGVVLLVYYYSVLRYRIISLSAQWLKGLSYIIIICTAAIIYMIIFYIIFTAIFKVPNPSSSIFVLNFIMITIVLLLFPVMSELTSSVRSLIQTNQVDLPYIIRKMNSMTTNVNLNELSDFLADHMHFSYIGIIVDGKLYGASQLPVTAKELRQITLLKSNGTGRIWQDFNEPVAEICNRENINAIAELRDAKGKQFGQLLVGKPLGKMGFERRDLIQIEMIVNLVAAMIDTKAK